MTEAIKQRLFLRTNRFQRPVINLVTYSSLITIAILAICVSYLYYDMTNAIIDSTAEVPTVKMSVILILMVLPLIFLVIIVLVYNVTNRLVGAFERILSELDDILAGKGKKHIHARKGDVLAEELLRRINTLIDKIS